MKFVDLKELKVHKEYSYDITFTKLGKAQDLFNLPLSEFKKRVNSLFDSISPVAVNKPMKFVVEIEGCETVEDFEYFADQAVDAVIRNNTRDKKRDREYRLSVPQNLKELNCNVLPLHRAVNYECYYDIFTIVIYDTEKGWEYKIVSEN